MAIETATRWNLVVSKETDKSLRQYLAESGGGHKGDLSRFVEEAVRKQLWHLKAQHIQALNEGRSQEEIESIIDEAVAWARQH